MSRSYDINDPADYQRHQVKWARRSRFVEKWFGWCPLPFEIKPSMGTPLSWYPIKRICWDTRFRVKRLFCNHSSKHLHKISLYGQDITMCYRCATRWTPECEVYTCKDGWQPNK